MNLIENLIKLDTENIYKSVYREITIRLGGIHLLS